MITTAISVARQLLLGEMPVVSKSMTAIRSKRDPTRQKFQKQKVSVSADQLFSSSAPSIGT
jgi:hypothetical protein